MAAKMTYHESADGWHFETIDSRVQMIQIDFRLSLLISNGAGDMWVRIETAGHLASGTNATLFAPAETRSLAPVLELFNAKVDGVYVKKTGRLEVRFEDNRSIEVQPDRAYEAWQVEYLCKDEKLVLVCAPGSEVVVFREASAVRDASKLN